MRRITLLTALLCLSQTIHAQTLLVGAAADLAPMEQTLTAAFHKQTGLTVRFSFGSSGMLARQVRSGAPFDLYLSANEQFVSELDRDGLLQPGSVVAYAVGRLGLYSASGKVKTLNDLNSASVLHLALPNPEHAPYGAAAVAMLKRTGRYDALQKKIVLAENVRQAYEYATTGNADAVITSWTLVKANGGVLLPDRDHPPIRQSGGIVKGAKNAAAAAAFLKFLKSPEGRKVLQDGGLSPID